MSTTIPTVELADTYQLADIDLTGVSTIVLTLLATAFGVFFAVKIFHSWVKKDWGLLVVEIIAGVVCAFFILDSSDAVTVMKDIGTKIFVHKSA